MLTMLVLVLLVFLHVLCKINFTKNNFSNATVQGLLIFISVSLPPHKVFTQSVSQLLNFFQVAQSGVQNFLRGEK